MNKINLDSIAKNEIAKELNALSKTDLPGHIRLSSKVLHSIFITYKTNLFDFYQMISDLIQKKGDAPTMSRWQLELDKTTDELNAFENELP